jgi:hypothetical protein
MMVNGKTIVFMGKVNIFGLISPDIRASIKTARNKDMVLILGLMEMSMLACGKMG